MKRIYFDHNATTPPDPEVLAAYHRFAAEEYGNPSSQHWFGQRARQVQEQARQEVADLIGSRPGEVCFTGSGTESDNLAIFGVLQPLVDEGKKAHLIISSLEHDAVEKTAVALERRGVSVTRLPVDGRGVVNPDDLTAALRPETSLVSVMHASNVVGTVQPLEALVPICREAGIPIHSDAVQTAGKLPLRVRDLGIDLLSISAHKFNGPKGCGALFVRSGFHLKPLLHGGGQERGLRSGTENVPLIGAMGVAARLAETWRKTAVQPLAALRDRMETQLLETIDGLVIHGRDANRLPNTSAISVHGVEGDTLAINLDLKGIAVSTGSACSSSSPEPSRILGAMGVPEALNRSSIRVSLGKETTGDEVDAFLDLFPGIVTKLRAL